MNGSHLQQRAALGAIVLAAVALAGCEREAPVATTEAVRELPPDAAAIEPLEPTQQLPGEEAGLLVFTTTGTVERVDRENGRITIRHEGVAAEGIPAGTTQFVAREADPLFLVEPGQEIEFNFARLAEGGYMLTAIAPTPPP